MTCSNDWDLIIKSKKYKKVNKNLNKIAHLSPKNAIDDRNI